MSITVAVNAADSTNGPQKISAHICQSAQQNNCGEYNGGSGGGGGDDEDDMVVLDHEKDQHKQLEKDSRDHANLKVKGCYNFRDFIRNNELNEENEIHKWEIKWNSLMSYIRTVYRMAMDGVEVERYPPHNIFKEAAYESKSCDSYHVFQNVENLVMEFVLEARARQVQILEKKNKDSPEMPQVFVFCLLDSYRRLMAATDHLKDVIKPIEEYHLSKFNLTWRMMNQYLYHSRLYADRKMYHLVTNFIEQILSISILSKSLLSASLIHDYTKFVKEVNNNITDWADVRKCIHNIKCCEYTDIKKYNETILKEENGLYPSSPPSNDDLVIDLTIPTPPQSPAPEYTEIVLDTDEGEDIDDDDGGSNYCDCIHDPPTVDSQQNSSIDLNAHNKKYSNLPDNVDINSLTFTYSGMKEKMLCFYSGETDEGEKPVLIGSITKRLGKKVLNSDAQVKSKPVVNLKCPITVERSITCKVELEQLPKRRYPYPHVGKSTEPTSKPNNRPVHGHSCHKHTEHVKRMHLHEEASECSSGRSSQDDSCSERSTSSPRQCDCCYCEVFGHGVPSVAPVSRNYQEMRDRLRNLYLLKKAKQNGHPPNETNKQKQKETNVLRPLPVHPPNQVSQPSDKSGAIKSVQQKKKVEPSLTNNGNDKSKSKKNNNRGISEKLLNEIVDFIEGNKSNEKRAAKKARRREKKEEMERIKKEEEEAERKRIEKEEKERKKQELERLKREEALKKERKKGKNQNKQQKLNQQQKQQTTANSKPPQATKQQVQPHNTQSSKKKNKQLQGNSKETIITKKEEKSKKDNVEGAKMVTIKRDSDSSKVTITFRGAVEDDVLCTLYDNEAIKAIQRLCDKNKQPQDQVEEKPNKKRSRNRKKKQTEQPETKPQPKPVESVLITNKNAPKLPTNMKWFCSPDVNITPVPSTSNSVQPQSNTILLKRTNNDQVFTRPLPPPSQPMLLTSPTAIQIKEAVNKISSSSAPIDINKLQLPPGITITKLDPSDYKPPRDIQQSTEKSKPTSSQFPFASPAAVTTPFTMQQNAQNNVVVVKTDGYDYEGTTEWSGTASKRNRRRKKTNGCNLDDTNSENIQPGFTITQKPSTRGPCNEEGKTIAGQIPTNTPRTMPLPVIIQRHGGMVTIRNPLYQRNDDAILTENNDSRVDGGDDDDANPSGKRRRRRRRVKGSSKQKDVEESVFEPKDIDLEDGEMDDDERELEAFKRFCLQSVPPQRKEKVHLNIKDIVLKKKSTAAAAAAAVGCV